MASTKEWKVRGSVHVTGLSTIVLDALNAELTDQTDIKMWKSCLSPGETLVPNLGSFLRVRSIILQSDQPVSLSVNGGAARPLVRLLIEWAEGPTGSLLDAITIENPATATADADVTLILGGDGTP
ncbi:MAG: hypothetical protein ACXABY_07315 [Candidatus Thorarchaeota archaeon]|jgi:hypothetical protein